MRKSIKFRRKIIYTISLFFFCISHLICANESSEEEFSKQRKGASSSCELGGMSQEEKRDGLLPTNSFEEVFANELKKFFKRLFGRDSKENDPSSAGSGESSISTHESQSDETGSVSDESSDLSTILEAEPKRSRRTAEGVRSLSLSNLYEESEGMGWKLKNFLLEDLPGQINPEGNLPHEEYLHLNEEEDMPQLESSSVHDMLSIK